MAKATIQLESIKCYRTEDTTGRDEVYIRVDGAKVWGPWSMNDGDEEPLEGVVPPREFEGEIPIEVWDQDQGWGDDDDLIETKYVSSSGAMENTLYFNGDGASYRLSVRMERTG